MRWLPLLLIALSLSQVSSDEALAANRVRSHHARAYGYASVPQIPVGARTRKGSPPESYGVGTKGKHAQSAPRFVTCTSANASSPSCYTATQQGRGENLQAVVGAAGGAMRRAK
jgi:hypothetical protein